MNVGQRAAASRVSTHHGLAVTPVLRWLVIHHSVPFGQTWKTQCDHCRTGLWPGACTPAGRCRSCQTRQGPPAYLLEAIAVLAALALLASGMRGWALAAHAGWAIGAIVLSFIDLAVLRLPHRLVAATTVTFLVLLVPTANPYVWLRTLAAGAVLAAFFGLVALAAPRHLGLGDVTVAFPVGAALGWHSWTALSTGVLLGLAAASLTGVALRLSHRVPPGTHLALGPYLLASAFVVACTQ